MGENSGKIRELGAMTREEIRAEFGEDRAISRGKISMNLSVWEISAGVAARISAGEGAVLELLGTERGAPNSVQAWADAVGTIPLEITTRFAAGLRREIENF